MLSQQFLSEPLIHSFIMSDLSDSLTVAHLSWAIWAYCSQSVAHEQMSESQPCSDPILKGSVKAVIKILFGTVYLLYVIVLSVNSMIWTEKSPQKRHLKSLITCSVFLSTVRYTSHCHKMHFKFIFYIVVWMRIGVQYTVMSTQIMLYNVNMFVH